MISSVAVKLSCKYIQYLRSYYCILKLNWLLLLSSLLMLLNGDSRGVYAISFTWGYVNKYAATIYEQEVLLDGYDYRNKSNYAVMDIKYPAEGFENDYTITAVHVYDMKITDDIRNEAEDANATSIAEILNGGIGCNYTTVRFRSLNTSNKAAYLHDIRYKLVIYGVDL